MPFQRPRGTQDILPQDSARYLFLEQTARGVFGLYNFLEIRTPIIEDASLFVRSLGAITDIVEKQMFIIERDEGRLALRPEGTAGLIRAYVENGLEKGLASGKFFYIGPMFRGERPQKGRLRQFTHIGCESISGDMPEVDAEVILLLDGLLRAFGLGDYKLKINTIGCNEDKLLISKELYSYLNEKRQDLCHECQRRLDKNVFRVLDCKQPACRAIARQAVDRISVCEACQSHFETVLSYLDKFGINYEEDRLLVRGLDYYTKTVFEVVHPNLSAGQDAIGAGGRYDNLLKEISGDKYDKGAVGFALGVERVLLCLGKDNDILGSPKVLVAYQDKSLMSNALQLSSELRNQGISCDFSLEPRSLKAQMRLAGRLKARFVILLGEEEIRNSTYTLKDMDSSVQKSGLSWDALLEKISS